MTSASLRGAAEEVEGRPMTGFLIFVLTPDMLLEFGGV